MIKCTSVAFKDWFYQKMLEYEHEVGERIDQKQFARHLKIGQSSVSQLLAGDYLPRGKNFDLLYDRYGDDFLRAMGIKRQPQDPVIAALEELQDRRDQPEVDEIFDLISKWLSDRGFIKTKDTRDMR